MRERFPLPTSVTLAAAAAAALVSSLIAPAVRAETLPYNPHRLLLGKNDTLVYIFAPAENSYQASLSTLNISSNATTSETASQLFSTLPFLSTATPKSFIPIAADEDIKVLAGSCSEASDGLELWQWTASDDYKNGTWTNLTVTVDDTSLSANFLSAGVSFSQTTDADDALLYVFGGMCTFSNTTISTLNASDWVSDADYYDTMITIEADSDSSSGETVSSLTDEKSSPIAEAGMSLTPLTPWFSNISSGSASQQQDFVLLGGHTQDAFINMSQVAVFSLPQASWTFVTVEQPSDDDDEVEPRSGHTAVLTEDGTKIIVLGGWVGDIATASTPQLAVLHLGESYGGVGDWEWTCPDETSNPYADAGVYGHAAAMLPGGVMMVSGGRQINATSSSSSSSSSSKFKRAIYQDSAFLNTTSMTWSDTYVNPSSSETSDSSAASSSSSSKKGRDIGLGVGLGVGLALLLVAMAIYLWFYHKRSRTRAERERRLRKEALGTEQSLSSSSERLDAPYSNGAAKRSASWHNMQERHIENTAHAANNGGFTFWDPIHNTHQRQSLDTVDLDNGGLRQAERTGAMMEVPSLTRGLRKNVLAARGAPTLSAAVPGTVFRIEEEDENSQAGSIRHVRDNSRYSDPFKDPAPPLQTAAAAEPFRPDSAAEQRKRELQGWAEDWQSAVESLNLSRNPSGATQGRTYSSLSSSQPYSSGRGSPEKSDRTGSNISERSAELHLAFQRAAVDRSASQRSTTAAGHGLFSGAASAMGRLTAPRNPPTPRPVESAAAASALSRAASNRSVSMGMSVPLSSGPSVRKRDRADTFSSALTSFGPSLPGEEQDLLSGGGGGGGGRVGTPPGTPSKDKSDTKYARASSLTRTGVKAMGLLGSMKRVFAGGGGVDVAEGVAYIEHYHQQGSGKSSPTKSMTTAATETSHRRSVSTEQALLRGKRGAKDWADESDRRPRSSASRPRSKSQMRRKPLPGQAAEPEPPPEEPRSDDEWDIEAAVQKRVVQVMFTVPKEKLRVVNADVLSLLSSNRSDIDHDDDREREREISRMTSLHEGDEGDDDTDIGEQTDDDGEHDPDAGKGKQPLRD